MIYLLYVIHVIVCVFLILVVLLQQGKGADLSVFGGGSTQTAFGARSATTLLHKLTVASFVMFILTTVSIALVKGGPGGGTVMAGHGKKAVATKPALPVKAAPVRTAPVKTVPPAPAPVAPGSGEAAVASSGSLSPSGGIGRRARLRGVWGNPCRFESGLGHHPFQVSPALDFFLRG